MLKDDIRSQRILFYTGCISFYWTWAGYSFYLSLTIDSSVTCYFSIVKQSVTKVRNILAYKNVSDLPKLLNFCYGIIKIGEIFQEWEDREESFLSVDTKLNQNLFFKDDSKVFLHRQKMFVLQKQEGSKE